MNFGASAFNYTPPSGFNAGVYVNAWISTLLNVYAKKPTSGSALTASQITISTAAPTYYANLGDWYHSTYGRLIGKVLTDVNGNVSRGFAPKQIMVDGNITEDNKTLENVVDNAGGHVIGH